MTMSRRDSLRLIGSAALAVALSPLRMARAEPAKMRVHRSATCGCCGKWVEHMKKAGFEVEDIVEADMKAVKARLGVPEKMSSCHTAEIDGYVIEGHVPAQAVAQLLKERPKVIGLAAPGMPSGSPGMEGGEAEVYTLYLFDASGAREYGKWRGDKPA